MSAARSDFTEEKSCWAFFHNGVSTGLAISKAAKGIDTSWIMFNKPSELTNRHAGFLLALGLNGHLKSLAKWVAFKYLTPKHTMTSIGLLLGLSISYLGTMDTFITRLLSVHVTRMLPAGAAELNLSPLTQTTGIMGIGFLYCGCQHRRMSEVMLSEIENLDLEEHSLSQEILRDEGYRLAAGFALGLINLGKGKDLRGLRDMHIVDRLLAVAVGTKNVDVVHILDRATAGAIVAIALIYMKSNDENVAQRIDIPDTLVQFDYVRPDMFLLRTVAKHLIMWDSIKPSQGWVKENLPLPYRRRATLAGIHRLTTDDLSFFNIIAGLCFAMGLRFAGSGSIDARDVLLHYLDQFRRICKIQAANYDSRLTKNAARNCQDVIALSAAAVMAGTGDIPVFRRLRSLHGRADAETTFGSHMAAHMAIGFLFLGGGTYTLGTSNLAVASLLLSLYPIYPMTILDNKCHLQAFRHMWVLAVEPRCLIPRDYDTRCAITVPITLKLKTGEVREAMAPVLLPELSGLVSVTMRSPQHWEISLDFVKSGVAREKFREGDQSIYLRRKPLNALTKESIFDKTVSNLSQQQDILPTSHHTRNPTELDESALNPRSSREEHFLAAHNHSHQWSEWIFNLSPSKSFDDSDKATALSPQSPGSHNMLDMFRPNPVDIKFSLEKTVEKMIKISKGEDHEAMVPRDKLWQLRLLFAWIDGDGGDGQETQDTEGEPARGIWIGRDTLERLRWKLWGVYSDDTENL
ncbi:Anaphase-promoting complex subunit 1 [Ascosphaera atra]|nr:Anaphase-promoting complex subunit 1 [Ascosphaera atra]